MSEFIFELTAEAKKTGGDKYTCATDPKFIIYFPQSVSRIDGKPMKTITLEVTNGE